MPWNIVMAWGGATAPGLFGKDSGGLLYRVCSSEDKKRDGDKGKGRS